MKRSKDQARRVSLPVTTPSWRDSGVDPLLSFGAAMPRSAMQRLRSHAIDLRIYGLGNRPVITLP